MENNDRELRKFSEALNAIITKFKSTEKLDKDTQKHQKVLEDLLAVNNKILAKEANKGDVKAFNELVDKSDMSFRLMKQRNKEDKEFQSDFNRAFDGLNQNATFANQIAKESSIKLSNLGNAVSASVGAVSGAAANDAADTLGDFLGPFGKIREEFISFESVSNAIGNVRERFSSKKHDGQFHAGVDSVPREGSYMLDGGERVVSADQNKDLTAALGTLSGNKGIMDVFIKGHDRDYFGDLISSQHDTTLDMFSMTKRHHKEIKHKFDLLNFEFSQAPMFWLSNFFAKREAVFERFQRHPILNSIGLVTAALADVMKPTARIFAELTFLPKLFRSIFTNEDSAKSDTDRIVFAIEDMQDTLSGRGAKDRRSLFKKGTDKFKDVVGNSFKNRTGLTLFKKAKRFVSSSAMGGGESRGMNLFGPTIATNIRRLAKDVHWMRKRWRGRGGRGGVLKRGAGLALGAVALGATALGAMRPMIGDALKYAFKNIGKLARFLPLGGPLLAASIAFAIGSYIGGVINDMLPQSIKTAIGDAIGKTIDGIVSLFDGKGAAKPVVGLGRVYNSPSPTAELSANPKQNFGRAGFTNAAKLMREETEVKANRTFYDNAMIDLTTTLNELLAKGNQLSEMSIKAIMETVNPPPIIIPESSPVGLGRRYYGNR